ncbi:MAG TPA: type II secretion system protein [Candidatus Limnocylindria bacterium]|nr:type II secretion system protein [Candidatus Limnocylindria bacterium]
MIEPFRRNSPPGFTLVEAVVSVSTVGAVACMLLPGLRRQGEQSHRAHCRENLRRLGVASHVYAGQNEGRLFSHSRGTGDWFTWSVSSNTFAQITNLTGEAAVDCPNLYPFTVPGKVDVPGGRWTSGWGYCIGFNYLGGIDDTNMLRRFGWESPVNATAEPSLVLFTDPNDYGYINGYFAIAPHTAIGAAQLRGATYIDLLAPLTSRALEAEGGNVGTLDGAVRWKQLSQMKPDNWIFKHDFGDRGMW